MRLTRDAEVDLDDGPTAELREAVEEQVRQRRYEPVVRLEFGPGADAAIKEMLRARFQLSPSDLYDMTGEVDYTTLFELTGLPIPELRDSPWTPVALPAFGAPASAIFSAIQSGDVLVHHPYESFDATVEHFISAAADDPEVISIKMTAYRIGDDTLPLFVRSFGRRNTASRLHALWKSRRALMKNVICIGSPTGECWRTRHVRNEGTQNTREDGTRRAQGVEWAALLCPDRHGQLPREDSSPLRGFRTIYL